MKDANNELEEDEDNRVEDDEDDDEAEKCEGKKSDDEEDDGQEESKKPPPKSARQKVKEIAERVAARKAAEAEKEEQDDREWCFKYCDLILTQEELIDLDDDEVTSLAYERATNLNDEEMEELNNQVNIIEKYVKQSSKDGTKEEPSGKTLSDHGSVVSALDDDVEMGMDPGRGEVVTTAEKEEVKRQLSFAEVAKLPPVEQKAEPITGVYKPKVSLYKSIRFAFRVVVPHCKKPLEEFSNIIQNLLKAMHTSLGKNVGIGMWDDGFGTKIFRKVEDIPKGNKPAEARVTFSNMFSIFIGPKKDDNKEGTRKVTTYLKIRFKWLASAKLKVAPEDFASVLMTQIEEEDIPITISYSPFCCQCPNWIHYGWLLFSTKSINQKTFEPEMRRMLSIPDNVACGVTWRTIKDPNKKQYQWTDKTPPPQAWHLEIEEAFAFQFHQAVANLFKKGSSKRVNGIQLRMVPCFAGYQSELIYEPSTKASMVIAANNQQKFCKNIKSTPSSFIMALDYPDPSLPTKATLRDHLMSRSPDGCVISRVFHNVDPTWNRPGQYSFTHVPSNGVHAAKAIARMIPECMYLYPNAVQFWFTPSALLAHADSTWDPDKKEAKTNAHTCIASIIDEDLWNVNDWSDDDDAKKPANNKSQSDKTTEKTKVILSEIPKTMAEYHTADDLQSFGPALGRKRTDASITEDTKVAEARKTDIQFDAEAIAKATEEAKEKDDDDGLSMSTMAKTTGTTRLKLKMSQEKNAEVTQEMKLMKEKMAEMEEEQCQREEDNNIAAETLMKAEKEKQEYRDEIEKMTKMIEQMRRAKAPIEDSTASSTGGKGP